ncbi:uncharacterized protein LOC135496177 [Lineus longissimus]|uniref:uncharacterized protein LOC135496177 n=1 Tax=Lineus longissimus TaxID=88925 RepID=UPI002B4DF79A
MEKNPAEDSAFQRLQQSGLLGSAGTSTGISPSLQVPTDEREPNPDAVKDEGQQPVSQEDAQILVDAQSLLAKNADGSCSFVIIQMDENGDGSEQSYAVKVEANEDGQALMTEADVTQALLALPTGHAGGVQFDTGNSEVTEANARYARLVEATSSKQQPFEILQSAAQAIADGMVFDLEVEPADAAEKEPESAAEGRLAQVDNLDDGDVLVLDDPFEKEAKLAAQFRALTQIQDINSFLSAVQKCTDPACGCRQYHCPICPKDVYKPAVQSKLKRHLYAHWKIRIDYRDIGIVRCYRSCHPHESHFHCPECSRLFTKRNTFILHLNTKHDAGVVDSRAAENEKQAVTRQEPKRKTPKVYHMVMAVIGPETLDYLGTHVRSVLEECQATTGVSYNMSEHNYCVLKGDLEAITNSNAMIDEFMDNIRKNPHFYDNISLGITTGTLAESVTETEKPVFVGGKSLGLECVEQGDDVKLTCESTGEIVACDENSDIPSRGDVTSDIPEQDPVLVGQSLDNDTNIEPLRDASVEQASDPDIELVISTGSGRKLLGSDEEVKSVEELCEQVKANVQLMPAEAESFVGKGEGGETDKLQETGTVDSSCSKTVCIPRPDVAASLDSERIECVISVIEASSMSDRENILKSSRVPTAVESVVEDSDCSVTPKKRGRKPKTSKACVDTTTADKCSKTKDQTQVTPSSTRSLRRKRSTYRDYQSRMDALVKPWTKKTNWDEDGYVSENDMVIKEEISDEEFGTRSRKRGLEDALYEPDAKLAKLDIGAKDGAAVIKRKRGRPRKTLLKSYVVEFMPGADENRLDEESGKAEVVFDVKNPAVPTGEGAVSDSVTKQRRGDVHVGDVQTGAMFDTQTPVGDPVVTGEESLEVPVTTVRESEEPDDMKASDSNTSALAAALLGKKMSESISPIKANKVSNLEEKSNVELDVIKDDKTGDIKLSLSVSFPKPNVKPIRRINRRQLVKGLKRYQCEVCDLVFQRCGQLTRHRLVTHGLTRAPRPKAVCDICGKEMRRKHLKAHIAAVHKSEKPWECDICQKSFSTHSYLKYHMSTHKDAEDRARPHLCSVCGRGFYKISQLQDHLNAHTGSRPYKCGICNKTFPYRSAIGKHMTVHSQDKPFECHICHKTFKSKDYLRNHQITHEPQSHPCPNCKRVYSYRHSLLMHCRRCPGTEGNQEEELDLEMPVNQCYMCGYCQEIFYDLETVQEHLTQHVQQEATTAEELMLSLASAEAVTEEQAAAIQLEAGIHHNDAKVIEDGLVPQSTVIVQDGLGNESTVYVQEDGTPVLLQGEAVFGDSDQGECVLVSDQDQVALAESNIPLTVTAEVQTSEGTVLGVPIILQSSQA